MTLSQNTHLRLIVSNADKSRVGDESPLPIGDKVHQLSLPFTDDAVIVLIDCTSMGRSVLPGILVKYHPKLIFDVRTVPTMTHVAGSRSAAFRIFDQIKAEYIDVFGVLGVKSTDHVDVNPAIWSHRIRSVFSGSLRGPVFMLFDSDRSIEVAEPIINDVFSSLFGRPVTSLVLQGSP